MKTLDELLPLARAGTDEAFQLVKATFIDSTALFLRNFSLHLVKVRILYEVLWQVIGQNLFLICG